MTEILLDSLMPIFVVMALGYLAGWTRDIDNNHLAELNALVMDFALPLSLFVATASTPRALLLAQWPLLGVLAVSMLVLYALSYWAQRRWFGLGSSEASVQTLTTAVPNYAGGLPLIAAVFGPTDTIFVALAIATASIVLSPLTLAILEFNNAAANGQRNFGVVLQAISRSLRKPIVLGPVAGVLFALLGIPLLEPISRSFQLIGHSAGGVALFLTLAWLSICTAINARGRLFDHLVGDGEHPRRHLDAEGSRRLKVDDKLELGRLHYRQVGGLGALEDAAGIDADLTPHVREVGSVAIRW